MKTIWKFSLGYGINMIEIEGFKKILDVQFQKETSWGGTGNPAVWFLCEPGKEKTMIQVQITGTGHYFYPIGAHVSTFQCDDGTVYHAFADKLEGK